MNLKQFKLSFSDNRGVAALEFAILLPVWLMIFFAVLDFSWYLTNLMVMENAVAAGARAGVKIRYWTDEPGETPGSIAVQAVKHSFWLSSSLKTQNIKVFIRDINNYPVDISNAEYKDYKYLEIRVVDYHYPMLAGYLSGALLPRSISAAAMMAFP